MTTDKCKLGATHKTQKSYAIFQFDIEQNYNAIAGEKMRIGLCDQAVNRNVLLCCIRISQQNTVNLNCVQRNLTVMSLTRLTVRSTNVIR